MPYELMLCDTADEGRRRLVRDALRAYNVEVCPAMRGYEPPGDLDVYLLDSEGQVQGGALSWIRWRWLDVFDLALAPGVRRRGLGTRVLRLAEAEARRRGCTHGTLHTLSFEARPFYEKLGYRVIAELPESPPGATYYWLTKELAAGPEERPGPIGAGYKLAVCEVYDGARREQVSGFLRAHHMAKNEAMRQAYESGRWGDPLDVYLLDERGGLAGGLLGHCQWHMLTVQQLWIVKGAHGLGWGRRMLELAEAEAHRRGCTRAQAHIHGFQAPGFWEKLGYRRNGEIPDYPPGYTFSWLIKEL